MKNLLVRVTKAAEELNKFITSEAIQEKYGLLKKENEDLGKMVLTSLVEEDELANRFMLSLESVPPEMDDDLPKEVAETYEFVRDLYEKGKLKEMENEFKETNTTKGESIMKKEKEAKKEKASPSPSKEKKEKVEKAEKVVKEKKEKVAKEKKEKKERNKYGHLTDTQSDLMDKAFEKGTTFEELTTALGLKAGRAKGHYQHLVKDKKVVFVVKGDKYKIEKG